MDFKIDTRYKAQASIPSTTYVEKDHPLPMYIKNGTDIPMQKVQEWRQKLWHANGEEKQSKGTSIGGLPDDTEFMDKWSNNTSMADIPGKQTPSTGTNTSK